MLVEAASPPVKSWRYPDTGSERDLRIDFIRGIVMVILVSVHIELFSVYSLFLSLAARAL